MFTNLGSIANAVRSTAPICIRYPHGFKSLYLNLRTSFDTDARKKHVFDLMRYLVYDEKFLINSIKGRGQMFLCG